MYINVISDGLETADQQWDAVCAACGWMLVRRGERRTITLDTTGGAVADIDITAPLPVSLNPRVCLAALAVAARSAMPSHPDFAERSVMRYEQAVCVPAYSETLVADLAGVTAACVAAARKDGVAAVVESGSCSPETARQRVSGTFGS